MTIYCDECSDAAEVFVCAQCSEKLRADLARVTAERDAARLSARAQARRFIRLADDKPYLARQASPLREELAEAQDAIDASADVSDVKLSLTRGLAQAYREQRDAARAQVSELLKVARAVRDYAAGKATGATAVSLAMALPPSMLEDPSDG